MELAKIRITRTVIFTSAIGYYLAYLESNGIFSWSHFAVTLLAISLVCSSSCAINHILEAHIDQNMSRTQFRPIPAKIISRMEAIIFSLLCLAVGVGLMAYHISLVFAICALGTLALYDFVYTPLKRISMLNTTVGAIPGALPIMAGYIAGGGTDIIVATSLFFVLFFWQHPHFYAIAWMYREDYQKGNYKMISLGDKGGRRTLKWSLITTVLLIATSITLIASPSLDRIYLISTIAIGIWFFVEIKRAFNPLSNRSAKRIVTYSVIYLPVWLLGIVIDQFF